MLNSVDVIACEDTRHTGILLAHYGIKNKLISYHEYNKLTQTKKIIELLKNKKNVALVSDAGTPGISDPGYYLIRAAINENLPVIPIPGPSAIITALVISGLPSDRFTFEGFLSKRRGRKLKKLKSLQDESRTMVFYDSPYRVLDTLKDMLEIFGDRKIVLARELTKKFETVLRGYISEIIKELETQPIRGEVVLVVSGKEENLQDESSK